MTEWFITSCVLKGEKFGESKLSRWPAYTALALAVAVGLLTSMPGLERFHVGIPALQCWLLAAFAYFGLRLLQYWQVASASRSAASLSVSLFSAAPELISGKQIQRIAASARGERD